MSGTGNMPMTFSQNGRMVGMFGVGVKNTRNAVRTVPVARQPHPQPHPNTQPPKQIHPISVQQRGTASGMPNSSSQINLKRLFNLAYIMANPGTPCKACGS